MNIESRKYHVNGIELNVTCAGDGPAVLLIHGFPDDHRVWRHQIPTLVAAGYRVIAPDTRGCGESQLLPEITDYCLDKLIDDMAALLDHLSISSVRLVAHDWGAIIGWHFACRMPDRVSRYAALSVGHPSSYVNSSFTQKLRSYYVLLMQVRVLPEWLLQLGDWRLLNALAAYPEEMPNWIESLSRPGRLRAAINYYRANLKILMSRDLPAAPMPVMGIWSDNDRFLTSQQMSKSSEYVTGSFRFECIKGANHWLQLTAHERVNTLLLDFLTGEDK